MHPAEEKTPRRAEAGGEYAYLRRGFGPAWGFLFGWMHSIVGRPASAASIVAGLLRFWGFLFPAVAVPFFTWHVSLPWMGKPYDLAFRSEEHTSELQSPM